MLCIRLLRFARNDSFSKADLFREFEGHNTATNLYKWPVYNCLKQQLFLDAPSKK